MQCSLCSKHSSTLLQIPSGDLVCSDCQRKSKDIQVPLDLEKTTATQKLCKGGMITFAEPAN